MLIWPEADDIAWIDPNMATQAAAADTSSGNSSWVLQYLEWNEPASVGLADGTIGFKAPIADAA